MFTAKTKKALCLSLLVSLTTQISAEGWYGKLKIWAKPKPLAVAACAGAAIYQYHQHKMVPIQALTLETQEGNQTFNINGLGFQAPNWQVRNGAMRGQITAYPTICAGTISCTESQDTRICEFHSKYTLDEENQERKSVKLSAYWPFESSSCDRSGHDIQTSPLAAYLYGLFSENEHKSNYAQILEQDSYLASNEITRLNQRVAMLNQNLETLNAKHTRVIESLNEEQ